MIKENIFLKVIKYLILIICAVCALLPVVYMISSSFMGMAQVNQSLSDYSFHIVPDSFTLIQYYEVFIRSPEFLLKFWNSIILTLPTVIGQIVISVLGAYAFAKIKFPFNKPIFFMFILLMLMPYQVTLVPIYIILKKMNLVGSYASVILPGMFSTFGVFLLTQFIKAIPDEQCQSAKVDGANHIQILFKIILPQCKGAVASLAILSFLDNWNMIEQPLILLENAKQPMSIFLSQINETELRVAFAAGVLFMIPSILIFLKGEKQLMEGIQHLDLK
ncbi:carbohydrate ABC transporter permease [Clostridium pasteurianum]|uniref:ABC-type sugar transport system, permease component n=1 Tax=Clostridium pasteurianum BC1 TaxID=86416 RepID=R4K2U8_CLOPA|nr:carbohydrate ABC transporter permease [Clostridium pasteurianum]AGK96026.1 ABC-type sugar transport system, permease component [Clostridium pasteurianum BC1]